MIELEKYWSEVHHTMLEVASYPEQQKMDTIEFFRQLKVWEKRAKEKAESLKSTSSTGNGRHRK